MAVDGNGRTFIDGSPDRNDSKSRQASMPTALPPVAVVYSWAIAAVIPVIIDAHAIAIRCRGRIGYGPYRSRWRKAITVEQHPRSSAIGTAVPTTAVVSVKDTDVPVVGVRAVAVGVIEVAITVARCRGGMLKSAASADATATEGPLPCDQ